jgi:hypothetical protein
MRKIRAFLRQQTTEEDRYQAGAAPLLGRTSTGWIAPAYSWRAHSISSSAKECDFSGFKSEPLLGFQIDDEIELRRLGH